MHVYPGVKQQDNIDGTSVPGGFESETPGGAAVVSAGLLCVWSDPHCSPESRDGRVNRAPRSRQWAWWLFCFCGVVPLPNYVYTYIHMTLMFEELDQSDESIYCSKLKRNQMTA